MIRLGTVVLGASDINRAMAFWSAVLGYEPRDFPGSENDFTILIPPSKVVLADTEGNRFCIVDASHG